MSERLSEFQGARPKLGGFAARLSGGPKLYLESMDGIKLPVSGRGRRYWVVSRGLCRFFSVPLLPDANRTKQLDAIALEVIRLSPFEQTGSHFHLTSSIAGIWLWDQQVTQAAGLEVGVDIGRLRLLPETALQPPIAEGLRLVEALDGIEGQYWRDGALTASRWWPRIPDRTAWLLFQRGASVPAELISAAVPAPLRLDWLDRPWTRTRGPHSFDLSRLDLQLVGGALAVAIVAGYGYQVARYLRASDNAAAAAREVEARSAAIEPLLAARTRALDNLSAIRKLHQLDRFPGQLTLMARVAEILPQDGARLDDWLYDRGQLELSIADNQPLDVVGLVRSLESNGYLQQVVADRTGNNNTVRLRASVVAR